LFFDASDLQQDFGFFKFDFFSKFDHLLRRMDAYGAQGHDSVRPVNHFNPPHICKMFHVPRYHNIQPIENRQCDMQDGVPKASLFSQNMVLPAGAGGFRMRLVFSQNDD